MSGSPRCACPSHLETPACAIDVVDAVCGILRSLFNSQVVLANHDLGCMHRGGIELHVVLLDHCPIWAYSHKHQSIGHHQQWSTPGRCTLTGESNLFVDNVVVGVQVLQCHLLEAMTPACNTHALGLLNAKHASGLHQDTSAHTIRPNGLWRSHSNTTMALLCGHTHLQPYGHACIAHQQWGNTKFLLLTAKEASAGNVGIADAVGDTL